MRTQVEVKLSGMGDAHIDGGSGRDVARLAALLLLVGTEQPRVMALLRRDVCDPCAKKN